MIIKWVGCGLLLGVAFAYSLTVWRRMHSLAVQQEGWIELLTYVSYSSMIFAPLTFFTTFSNTITDTLNSAVRMFEVLDMTPEITESLSPVRVNDIDCLADSALVRYRQTPF